MANILSAEKICKSFGEAQVLKDVTFNLEYNEIHGLMGENGAGKSTLMKIIAGDYSMDSGQLYFEGKPIKLRNPGESLKLGIRIIYQEFNLAKTLTVAENICIGDLPRRRGMVDWAEMNRRAKSILEEMVETLDVSRKVGDLSVAEQQVVEIAKALSMESKVLIMDEPTAALNDQETQKLFHLMRTLRSKGVSIVFITHRINEQFELSDRITVLRDGTTVGTIRTEEATDAQLVKMMVGRELTSIYRHSKNEIGEVMFEVKDLTVDDRIRNLNFKIRRGEIVSFFGLMGAGQDEICKALIGAVPIRQGELLLNGKKVEMKRISDACKAGIGYVSNDRKNEGLIPTLPVRDNISLAFLPTRAAHGGLIQKKKEESAVEHWIQTMRIRCASQLQKISLLSGGNQQKAMIARWLSNDTKLLILNMPTRGVDIGAKSDIYELLEKTAREGVGVLVFSLEMPEVLGISDRIYVLCDGEIMADVASQDATQDLLMQYAVSKYLKKE